MTGADQSTADRHRAGVILLGAVLAGLAVLFGAFGSHALKAHLNAEALGWWQTAVQYQMWHALAILSLGLANLLWGRLPALLLSSGSVVFSATLYSIALGAPRWLGAITPVGGVLMVACWALLARRAIRG